MDALIEWGTNLRTQGLNGKLIRGCIDAGNVADASRHDDHINV
jgi:hypothetical protein